MTHRCPRDHSLTYRVSRDAPPVCLLEWFSERTIYQPIKDFVPGGKEGDRRALLVLANQFAFPVSYMHKAGEVSAIIYGLGYRELQPLVGRRIAGVQYQAQRSVSDGRFDTMRAMIDEFALGIPMMGQDGCFRMFMECLFCEQEP